MTISLRRLMNARYHVEMGEVNRNWRVKSIVRWEGISPLTGAVHLLDFLFVHSKCLPDILLPGAH